MSEEIIRFEKISKNFGAVQAITEVSFSIQKGECHAIIGENGAGKSTLMHILAGAYPPSSGTVYIAGKEAKISNAAESKKLGISIVYQELKLCPNLSAAENVFLGKIPTAALGFVKRGNINQQVKGIMDRLKVDIDVSVPVSSLSPAQQQLVEIAKAIMEDASVLILDEPTSSLTSAEADTLFSILNELKSQGKTLIFISHRLNEIFSMADRITVMRDGTYLGTYGVDEINENELVKLIAGEKRFSELYASDDKKEEKDVKSGKVMLEVEGISYGNILKDISFKLYEGETLGFYGLQGAGRTELVESIFGLHGKPVGVITAKGNTVTIRKAHDAIEAGFGLITEDRKNRGIFPLMSVRDNIAVIHRKEITKYGFWIDNKKIDRISDEYVDKLSIRLDSIRESILNLSGGNQQKVLLARMLSTMPDIILADEPTRGVDVGAKAEIFAILNELKASGKAVIVISSELQEVVRECDRVMVLRNGRLTGEVTSYDNREQEILRYAFNG